MYLDKKALQNYTLFAYSTLFFIVLSTRKIIKIETKYITQL